MYVCRTQYYSFIYHHFCFLNVDNFFWTLWERETRLSTFLICSLANSLQLYQTLLPTWRHFQPYITCPFPFQSIFSQKSPLKGLLHVTLNMGFSSLCYEGKHALSYIYCKRNMCDSKPYTFLSALKSALWQSSRGLCLLQDP